MSAAKEIIKKLIEVDKVKPQKAHPSYLELIRYFPLTSITNQKQHRAALKVAEEIITFLNIQERDQGLVMYLKTLAILISEYEDKRYPSS